MPLPTSPRTADDLFHMPDDGRRYEIIRGDVFVMPAPSRFHQRAVVALLERLLPYVAPSGHEALASPLAVRAAFNTQVEPDVVVAPRELDHEGGARWVRMRSVSLAVEVLSEGTASRDRAVKRDLYLAEGVGKYWIVDIDAELVEVWTAASAVPRIVREVLTWSPAFAASPLHIPLASFFDQVRTGRARA
ncbi:MAG: Uma2 family endonuclease [Gemmatimonadaceae bacterium]|nr:Uma2 family endonuclease [Gemmatimonadaceae bacterium]